MSKAAANTMREVPGSALAPQGRPPTLPPPQRATPLAPSNPLCKAIWATGAATDSKFAPRQQQPWRFGGEEELSISPWRASLHGTGGSSGGWGTRARDPYRGCLQPQPAQLCLHCGDENSQALSPKLRDKAEPWQGGPRRTGRAPPAQPTPWAPSPVGSQTATPPVPGVQLLPPVSRPLPPF